MPPAALLSLGSFSNLRKDINLYFGLQPPRLAGPSLSKPWAKPCSGALVAPFFRSNIDPNQNFLVLAGQNTTMAGKKDNHLSSVERRVSGARRSIERQRRYIDALGAGGSDIEDAERTLKAIVQALSILESYLRSLSQTLSKSVQ